MAGLGGFSFPHAQFQVPESSAPVKMVEQAMARQMQQSMRQNSLSSQLSLMRTLKSLGLMNGFTDPVTGEWVRTPGQKMSKDERKEFLEQKHQRDARNAILNNEALFERLRENQNLSAEKRLQNLRDIKKTDIAPIAKQYGVDAGSVYKGLFGELDQEYAQAKKEVEDRPWYKILGNEARLIGGDTWEAIKSAVSNWSAQDKLESAQKWNQERQAIIESDPYLADQAKREAEGEGYFERMGGSTGSIFTNVASTMAGFTPYVGATLAGGLAGPYGAIAAPAALGAAQGTFGLAQRAAADPTLSQEQKEAAVGPLPSIAAGTLSGTLAAIPGNIGRLAPRMFGRAATRRALQEQMPGASAATINRSLQDALTARSAAYAAQHPVRNALLQGALVTGGLEGMMVGGQLGSNIIYNMATGSEAPITQGLGEAAAQGLVGALPFGVLAYRQRPAMPESYRLGKEGAVRRLTVDEYAERIRNQYSKDPTNNAAMTGILQSAKQDLGNMSFDGLMGRVLAHPNMKNLSPETVGQWEKLFNVGVRDTEVGPRTTKAGGVQDDTIPGMPARSTPAVKGTKPTLTEEQRLMQAVNTVVSARKMLSKVEAQVKEAGGDEAALARDQGIVLNSKLLDKILTNLGAKDVATSRDALNRLEAYIDKMSEKTKGSQAIRALREAINIRRELLPEPVSTPVVDANGRKIADSFNVRPAEIGGPDARPEQPASIMGGNGQEATARVANADTSVPGGVAPDSTGTSKTTANGTPVQDTGAGTAAQGGGAGGAEAPNVRTGEGANVPGEAQGATAAGRGTDTGPSVGEVPRDAAAGAGAREPADTGGGKQDGAKPTEGAGRRVGGDDTEIVIRSLNEAEARSPDTEFFRLNNYIDTKNDMMFAGAVGGYTGPKTAAARRKYVADLMEGLYRTALDPNEVLPTQTQWKVSKYLVANKGVNPMSEGMAEGIHKLWNNAEGISEREYLLNTLRDPDEQRKRILENVKCQLIIARRIAK